MRLGDLLERNAELAREPVEAPALEQRQVVAHDARRQRVVARPSWRSWISRHSARSRAATPGGSNSWMRRSTRSHGVDVGPDVREERDLLERQREVAVGVEAADDERAELLLGVGHVGQPELPHEVVGQQRAA